MMRWEWFLYFIYAFHIAALLWHMPKVLSWSSCGRYLPNSRMWVWFCTRWSMWEVWEAFESNWIEKSQMQGRTLPSQRSIRLWFHLTLYTLSIVFLIMPVSFCWNFPTLVFPWCHVTWERISVHVNYH